VFFALFSFLFSCFISMGPPWIAPLLLPKGLDAIANYKYKSGGLTALDIFLSPHYDRLTERFPRWFAPNLITVAGAIPLGFAYVCLCMCCSTASEQVPRWLLLYFGCSVVFYAIMDCLDGKQARRTGTASPLGQLVDHGMDCALCLPQITFMAAIGGFGASRVGLAMQVSTHVIFFLCQWQEHHTGVVITSFGYLGVTEIACITAGTAFAAGSLSPESFRAFQQYPVGVLGFNMSHTFAFFVLANAVYMICYCLANTLPIVQKRGNIRRALVDLIPIAVLGISAFMWGEESVTKAARPVSLLIGTLAYIYTAQMILSSMAQEHYNVLQPSLQPYVTLVLLSRVFHIQHLGPVILLCVVLLFLLANWWSLCIIIQLKAKLGVQVFRIPVKSAE